MNGRTGERATSYTISDHPYLLNSPTRELVEAFRREVMALDPRVTEEYLKQYVAYKAEINVVDAIPQATRLRLSLNISPRDLHDPRAICRDISQISHRGSGDIDLPLAKPDELPSVLGHIRQALERQLDPGVNS